MPDVRQGAVERDPVADVDVEPVLPVSLIHAVGVCQWKRLALLSVAWREEHVSNPIVPVTYDVSSCGRMGAHLSVPRPS